MEMLVELPVQTDEREQLVDVTGAVSAALARLQLREGAVLVASKHTTAAVTINEGHDPDVASDLLGALARIVPQDGYDHAEGNSDAHVKVSLVGPSVFVPVSGGKLVLGTWQKVFFCEFDGPRSRTLVVSRAG